MPLRNDLLNPISADNPTGTNLRYDPLFDKIKEARREDPPDPQGDWQRERKLADWLVTIKLTGEALATKTKDLQLAVWLAQALLRREGIASFRDALEMIRGLLETFWDGLYPEIEDGELDLRKAPLEWIGTESDREPNRPVTALKLVPITRGGLTYVQFSETREVGPEEAADSYEKQQIRAKRIEEGKTAPEVFDKDFDLTPKDFYVDLEKTFDSTLESLTKLEQFCEEKFKEEAPSFRALRDVLVEIRQSVHILLLRKREKEPDAVVPGEEGEHAADEGGGHGGAQPGTGARPVGKPQGPLAPLPVSWDDAVSRVVTAAQFMRQHSPANPSPYLMLRALRWGELRAAGPEIDPAMLIPPPPDVRQALRRATMDTKWDDVLEMGETAMGTECGRGWLDLQHYIVRACQELGGLYEPVRRAIVGELGALIETFPKLPEMTMMDDMPVATPETQAWLKRQPFRQLASAGTSFEGASLPLAGAGSPSRTFELAMLAAAAGRMEVCTELLSRDIAQEPSGRGKFQRRLQVARLCQAAGHDAMAVTILQEAASEIESKSLEQWESRELLASALATLYRCLMKTGDENGDAERIYTWVCRLDPLEAMKLVK